MQRPGGEAPPQFRNGPPLPPGSGPRPGMMNMGRPYAPPPIQGRGPMMHQRPQFPHGQQSPRFGPPQPPMLPPGNLVAPPTGQPMPAAPPHPNIALPPRGTMPSRPLTGPAAAGSSLPIVGPRGPLLLSGKQPLPPATLNLPQSPIVNAPQPLAPPLHAVPVQVPQGPLIIPSLLSQPPRPKDDEIIRNIEILVQFVLKNGPEFENMARAKQAGNPKFSFLFGGELGSDAAIGYEYYQWLKRKGQVDQSVAREGEAKAQLEAPLASPDSNQQQKDSKIVHLEGPLTVSVVSDMEVDMDMEGITMAIGSSSMHQSCFKTNPNSPLWKYVEMIQQLLSGGGYIWICGHCKVRYSSSYSRVKDHLCSVPGQGIKSCLGKDDKDIPEALVLAYIEEQEKTNPKTNHHLLKKRSQGMKPSLSPSNFQPTESHPFFSILEEQSVASTHKRSNGLLERTF